MAPQKNLQPGHSADAIHAVPHSAQWVVQQEIEVAETISGMGMEQPASRPAKVDSSHKKARSRKQKLKHRLVVKGFQMKEVKLKNHSADTKPNKEKKSKTYLKRGRKPKNIEKEITRLEQLVFRDCLTEEQAPQRQGTEDLEDVGLCEEVVTSLEREWCSEGNEAAASLLALEGIKSDDPKPAWVDEEEEAVTVEEALLTHGKGGRRRKTYLPASAETDRYGKVLQQQFEGVVGNTPTWARLEKVANDEEDYSLSRYCGALLADNSRTLAPTTLQFSRVTDLTEKGASKRTIITAVDFHPKMQAAVVASRPGMATFYQVDGNLNERIQSVMFENFPITTAKFAKDGSELLLGSEYRTHLQSFDVSSGKALHIPCPVSGPELNSLSNFTLSPDGRLMAVAGRDGSIVLLTARTREMIGSFKMSGKCRALEFNSDGSQILTYGKEGQVYIWDVKERRCWHKFHDEGCLQGLSLAVSPDDRYVACGSGSGVVNIYSGSSVLPRTVFPGLPENPRPSKAIMNLTTSAHQVIFNSSAQILATVSRCKDSAVKFVHLPSQTVFANFPTAQLQLAKPEAVAFSPNGGYFAVGNNIGAVRLIRLHHYPNY